MVTQELGSFKGLILHEATQLAQKVGTQRQSGIEGCPALSRWYERKW